jgi:hypothetical protein
LIVGFGILLLFVEQERLGNLSIAQPVFYCQKCFGLVSKGVKAVRFVESTRVMRHPYRPKAHKVVYFNEQGNRKVKMLDDPGGLGTQIEHEICVCPQCALELRKPRNPVQVE